MEDQLFKIPPFDCENVPLSELRQTWFDYKKQFEYVAEALSKKKRRKLKSIFLAVGGRQLQRVYENLTTHDDEAPEGEDEFSTVIRRLDKYFAPKRHDTFERYSFWTLAPSAGETLDKFLLRAKTAANKCQFGSTERESRDAAVVDKVVMLAPPDLRRKILERSNINLDDLTKLVNSHLSIQQQVRELNQHAQGLGNMQANRSGALVNKIEEKASNDQTGRWTHGRMTTECGRCGNRPHKPEDVCPAKNEQCRICNYFGHFAKKCRTDPKKYKMQPSIPEKRKLEEPGGRQHTDRIKVPRTGDIEVQKLGVRKDVREKSFVYAISDNHDEMIWCKVREALSKSDWSDEIIKTEAKAYVPFQKDLSLLEGCVIRGCRLVIPKQLRPRMLQLAHEGHPGETVMISRL